MNPLARLRLLVARRPWLYWLAVLAVAAASAAVVADAVAGVDEARRAWGASRAVVIATRDVRPGEPAAGAVATRSRPAPMVPVAAVAETGPNAVFRQHVSAGEIVVEADLAPTAAPQARIPPGWRAVAIAERVPSGAAVGDGVDVASGGIVLADEAVVVGAAGDTLLVAVPAAEAAAVAAAAGSGDVALLLER
jgi:hypothetical protein